MDVTTLAVMALVVAFVVVAAAIVAVAVARQQRAAVRTLVAVAREELGAHTDAGTRALDTRNELMDQRLDGMHAELDRVRDLVQQLEADRQRSFGALSEQLQRTGTTTAELAEVTRSLRETLGNSRTRGQWGERMADDVLRIAGFVEGVNYVRQSAAGAGRPDVTFLLPGDRVLHMDVKFPLDNYVRALEAPDDDARERAETRFLRDVRDRVRELAQRGYAADPHALDEVLLFIPNEHVFAWVQEHDATLLDDAMRQHVVLCCPSTLFAVLAVIRQAVDAFAVDARASEILDLLAGFTDQWQRFTAQMDRLGERLDAARRDYDALTTTRRRQLERQLERVDDIRGGDGSGRVTLRALAAAEDDVGAGA